MKIKSLPVAMGLVLAAPGLAMAAGPVVYGKANVSLEHVDVDAGANDADRWELVSNDSRVGIKGDSKINSQLKATYLAEWELSSDGSGNNDGEDLKARNRSLGLAGDFGALDVGKFDTPVKTAQGKIDQFNDQAGDIKYVLVGDVRADDIVQYTSPAVSGFQAKLAVMPGEQFDTGQSDPRDQLNDAMSMSVSWTQGATYVALASDSEVKSDLYDGTALTDDPLTKNGLNSDKAFVWDTHRLVAQMTFGQVQVGGLYQIANTAGPDNAKNQEQTGYLLSANYTIDKTVVKAQYTSGKTENEDTKSELDADMAGVGVDQKLSDQTTVFAFYNTASYQIDANDEEDKDNIAVGVVHVF